MKIYDVSTYSLYYCCTDLGRCKCSHSALAISLFNLLVGKIEPWEKKEMMMMIMMCENKVSH